MSSCPALERFSMADSCLTTTLPVHFRSSNSFHRRSKSIPRIRLSSSSLSLSALPLLIFLRKDKKPSVVPLVARTSGWIGEESSDWKSGEGIELPDGEFMAEGGSTESGGFVEGEAEESYPELLEEAKLFVGNLPYDVDSEKLARLFEGAGIVEVAEWQRVKVRMFNRQLGGFRLSPTLRGMASTCSSRVKRWKLCESKETSCPSCPREANLGIKYLLNMIRGVGAEVSKPHFFNSVRRTHAECSDQTQLAPDLKAECVRN